MSFYDFYDPDLPASPPKSMKTWKDDFTIDE